MKTIQNILIVLVICFCIGDAQCQIYFSGPTLFPAGSLQNSMGMGIASGDVNGDGKIDLSVITATLLTSVDKSDLADHCEVSRVMIGKYERGEAVPSIDAAKLIADALEVSLDFLVGEGQNSSFDKKTLQRLHELELLDEPKKSTLFDLIDTYIKDAKARKAYA